MVIVPRYLTRRHGIDRPTAWLCAIPGALSYVIALASVEHVGIEAVNPVSNHPHAANNHAIAINRKAARISRQAER